MTERSGEKPRQLNILYIPVPYSTFCVGGCGKIIPKDQEAIQSPSTPGEFYHFECFKNLIRDTGKDPDKVLRIINDMYPPSGN